MIIAPLGFGMGMNWGTDELCDDITGAITNTLKIVNHIEYGVRHIKMAVNDALDCNPLEEPMQRLFCDLYCIEDAVKKGDKAILDTIGNLYEKIKLTTKQMFDFYITQVVTKMGAMQ